jgi:hypothetical protein
VSPRGRVSSAGEGQRGLNPVLEIVWSEGECVIGIAFNQLRVAALLNEGECYEYSQLAGVGIRSQPPRVGRPVTRSRNKDIPLARGYMSCTRVPIVFLFFN